MTEKRSFHATLVLARRLLANRPPPHLSLANMLVTETDIAHVAEEIARYLQDHPNAADTVDGVLRWWLQRQRLQDSADAVRLALDHLVQQGTVTRTVMRDGVIVYANAPPITHRQN